MLELHIYSPPSSVLPSLTPPCIALLSYLLKTQQPGTWTLHASNNPYLPSPQRGLPALHDRDSGVWTSGFRASINYLHLRRRPSSSDGESAEVFALGNYIECEGGRVLDSYMFFTDANFDLLRGVIGRGIGGLARYWLPGVLRSEAVGRCGGVIPLASPAPSGSGSDGSALTAAALPKSRDQISVQEAAERIKQHSLADNFLSTLQSYLSSHPRASGNGNGSRRYLLPGDNPTSADFLALGYLSLALHLDLPNPWLRDELRGGFPELCAYVEELMPDFGELPWGEVRGEEVPGLAGYLSDWMGLRGVIASSEGGWSAAGKITATAVCVDAVVAGCTLLSGVVSEPCDDDYEVIGGEDDDDEDEEEMELLKGFGSAEAILGLSAGGGSFSDKEFGQSVGGVK